VDGRHRQAIGAVNDQNSPRYEAQHGITEAVDEYHKAIAVAAAYVWCYVGTADELVGPIGDRFEWRLISWRKQDADGDLSFGIQGALEPRRGELQVDRADLAIGIQLDPAAITREIYDANAGGGLHFAGELEQFDARVRCGNAHWSVDTKDFHVRVAAVYRDGAVAGSLDIQPSPRGPFQRGRGRSRLQQLGRARQCDLFERAARIIFVRAAGLGTRCTCGMGDRWPS